MTTINNVGVVMFSVSDVDAAIAFYVDTLGFELRADTHFGPEGENRWTEVAPPGSVARIALTLPMGDTPGGGSVGVETTAVRDEHARLTGIGGVDVDAELMEMPGAPAMFSLRDPDGNALWVTEPAPE